MKDNRTFDELLDKCIERERNEFSRYDQSVDVVSCWQAYFENEKHHEIETYFDRFPHLKIVGSGKDLTPDFTSLINKDYGIIFDLKTGIPANVEKYVVEELLPQLKKYDGKLKFLHPSRIEDGVVKNTTFLEPSRKDIVIIINSTQSDALCDQLFSALRNVKYEKYHLSRNPIILEYHWETLTVNPYYRFKRVQHSDNGTFDDGVLGQSLSLHHKLTVVKDPLRVSPEYFSPFKVRYFSNDYPPPIYTLSVLWMYIFPSFLRHEKNIITDGIPSHKITFITTVKEISDYMNKMIPNAVIRHQWLEDAFKYGIIADLVKQANNTYEIEYREINKKRTKKPSDQEEIRSQEKDYARLLAERYCKNKLELERKDRAKKDKTKSKETGQGELFV